MDEIYLGHEGHFAGVREHPKDFTSRPTNGGRQFETLSAAAKAIRFWICPISLLYFDDTAGPERAFN